MDDILIKAKKIYKRVRDKEILALTHLTVKKNEVVGLYGPNGAGKSSLLRILSLIDRDYQGELSLFDQQPRRNKERLRLRRRMAMVLDQPAIFQGTVEDNMVMGLKFRGVNRQAAEIKISWSLALLGIDHLRRQKASQLSRGEAQRLCLARALALSPEILFLDEPLSGFDAATRASLYAALKEWLRRDGQTSIYVSHDLAEVKQLADRVIYMANGRLVN